MIKNIVEGPGISVQDTYASWPSFYNNSATNNNTLVGQVRYNGSGQCMEVYDGMTWLSISSTYPTVGLTSEVQTILNWAREKMTEEQRLLELAKTNPTLADALGAMKRAEEQVKIVAALVDNA